MSFNMRQIILKILCPWFNTNTSTMAPRKAIIALNRLRSRGYTHMGGNALKHHNKQKPTPNTPFLHVSLAWITFTNSKTLRHKTMSYLRKRNLNAATRSWYYGCRGALDLHHHNSHENHPTITIQIVQWQALKGGLCTQKRELGGNAHMEM